MSTNKVIYNVIMDEKTKNGRGERMLKIKASISGRSVSFPTNIFVYKHQFKEEMVIEHPQAKQLNALLCKHILDLQAYELDAFKNDIDVTIQSLCTMYVEHITKDTPLIEFNDHVMKYCTNRREVTKRKYYDVVKLVDEYHKGVCLEDIDIVWLKKYEAHMLNKGNQMSSIQSTMKCIRALFNEAIKRDILKPSQNPFKLYCIKEMRSRDDVLSFGEVEELELYGFDNPVHRNIRDIFCFACYTGLRWYDLRHIKSENIVQVKDTTWLRIKTHKTDAIVQIPLSTIFFGNAIRILEKYEHIEDMVKYATNSGINRGLKEVLDICGIGGSQRITMHTARRSFITALADFGTPIATIQKLAGHARITTTSKYLQLSVGMIKKDLDRAFNVEDKGVKVIHVDLPKKEILRKTITGKDLVIGSEYLKCHNCSFCEGYVCRLFHKKKSIHNDWCDSFSERLPGEPYHYSDCKQRDDNHMAKLKLQKKKRESKEKKTQEKEENEFKLTSIDIVSDSEWKENIKHEFDDVINEEDFTVAIAECEEI